VEQVPPVAWLAQVRPGPADPAARGRTRRGRAAFNLKGELTRRSMVARPRAECETFGCGKARDCSSRRPYASRTVGDILRIVRYTGLSEGGFGDGG
jgi:hypothetical protein